MRLVDRTRTLGDSTVGSLQDQFELSKSAKGPPTIIPRDFSHQGYWVKGIVNFGNLVSSTLVAVNASLPVSISFLDDVTALTTVFDQYCVAGVIYRITPMTSDITSPSVFPGKLYTVIDHDDSSALPTIGAALEYSSVVSTNGYIGHTRLVEPRVAIAAYNGAFTGYANQRSYIDCASIGVQHYGLKVIADVSTGAAFTYTIEAEVFVHFRDSH